MALRWRLAAIVLASVITLTEAAAKKKPTPCAPGTFTLADADAQALSAAIGEPMSALTLTGTELSFGSCSGRSRTKARRKVTTITAKLARCGGLKKVKFRGTIASPACDQLRATLKAKRHRAVKLAATRADGPPPTLPPTTRELIQRALREGRIDYPTSLAYRMWAVNVDPQLPEEFDAPGLGSEDDSLGNEIRDAWPTLPPGIQAALAPYVARPDDPASAYGPASGTPAPLVRAAQASAPAEKRCPNFWTYAVGSTAFVTVWDCSSGDPAADQAFLGGIAALFDKHWTEMTRDMDPPDPDDAGRDASIDVYLLRGGECMPRAGGCKGLEPSVPGGAPALGRTVPASPYLSRATGGEHSSAYILLKRGLAVAGGPTLEDVVVHEFFHVLQRAHTNTTGRANAGSGINTVFTFFTEASATWAEWVYLPAESAMVHNVWWAGAFMPVSRSLLLIDGRHEYGSYIWPFFVQQEKGAPQAIFDAWKAAESASGPEDVEKAVDTQLDFRTNFREFAVRNLNWKPPGNPLGKTFGDLDSRLPKKKHNDVDLMFPTIVPDMAREATSVDELPSLTARYRRYPVSDDVHHIIIDFEVNPVDSFDADAIVKVGDTWRRVPKEKTGRRLEFCRDDPEERVKEIVLVLSNHARDRDAAGDPAKVSGNYFISTNTPCGTWSGTITYEESLVEFSDETDAASHRTVSNDRRRHQTWNVISTGPINAFGQMLDGATLAWHGSVAQTLTTTDAPPGGCLQGAVISTTTTTNGEGSGQEGLAIQGPPGGPFILTPVPPDPPLSLPLDIVQTATICPSMVATFTSTGRDYEALVLIAGVPGLVQLTPSSTDANAFAGTYTLLHDEQPRPGGSEVLDAKFSWSLRHRPAP